MNNLNKKTISFISVAVCALLLAVTGVVLMKQHAVAESLDSLTGTLPVTGMETSTPTDMIEYYADENLRLQQELASAVQSIKEWQAQAENTTVDVIYVPEYHVQTTVKEVAVDKPVYVNNEWREFESVGRLTEWVEEHLAYLWMVGDKIADCDDYAARLQLEAFKDGYLLSLQIVSGGMIDKKNVSNYTVLHMGNLAMIGNDIYFIEPQPDYFRIVFVCNRD